MICPPANADLSRPAGCSFSSPCSSSGNSKSPLNPVSITAGYCRPASSSVITGTPSSETLPAITAGLLCDNRFLIQCVRRTTGNQLHRRFVATRRPESIHRSKHGRYSGQFRPSSRCRSKDRAVFGNPTKSVRPSRYPIRSTWKQSCRLRSVGVLSIIVEPMRASQLRLACLLLRSTIHSGMKVTRRRCGERKHHRER